MSIWYAIWDALPFEMLHWDFMKNALLALLLVLCLTGTQTASAAAASISREVLPIGRAVGIKLFSDGVLEACGGWNFFLLTEDIEFTIDNVVRGEKVGYAAGAVLYDEQPTSFAQSWRQRMRWSKGYLQVFRKYASELFSGIARGSFSCYDMTMNIMPAAVLTGLSVVVNIGAAIANATSGGSMAVLAVSVLQTLMSLYLTLFVLGAITTVTEWKNIRCAAWKKVLYAFTFPLFMLTYVPICIASLFTKVEWKPICHTRVMTLEQIEEPGLRAS